MKIYEKPSIEIKKFEVEDIITVSGEAPVVDMKNLNDVSDITGNSGDMGISYEW